MGRLCSLSAAGLSGEKVLGTSVRKVQPDILKFTSLHVQERTEKTVPANRSLTSTGLHWLKHHLISHSPDLNAGGEIHFFYSLNSWKRRSPGCRCVKNVDQAWAWPSQHLQAGPLGEWLSMEGPAGDPGDVWRQSQLSGGLYWHAAGRAQRCR